MNNGYDAVFRNLPVSFYAQDPYSGSRRKLDPLFLTDRQSVQPCDTFSAVVNSPDGDIIFAVVNDKGGAVFPDTAFKETDITNNASSLSVTRFRVSVTPSDTFIYRNQLVELNASSNGGAISSYNWSPTTFLSCVNCLDPKVRVQYSQQVVFTAKNRNQCTASDTSHLTMYTDGPVNIPNAFTPNGDGKNDVFYVLGSRDIDIIKRFAVYDRYGQPVFQANNVPPNDPSYGWRGEVKNGERSTSSYVYSIIVRFKDGREQLYKGTVTVIR
jgi:gliding motility-associated-like protein